MSLLAGHKFLQYAQPKINAHGQVLPGEKDKPFFQLYFSDALCDFSIKQCCQPGPVGVECACVKIDVTYNRGPFLVVVYTCHPSIAFKDKPAFIFALAITYLDRKVVHEACLKRLLERKPQFRNVRVVITDGAAAEFGPVKEVLPNAAHFFCSVHVKKNFREYCTNINLGENAWTQGPSIAPLSSCSRSR